MKTIVITGVSRGLGRGLCDELIRLGHAVIGVARTAESIASLRLQHPTPHDFALVDVADAAQVEAWASRVISSYGAPDLLVNNAGIMNTNAMLWEVSPKEFEQVLRVNLLGTFHCIRAFVPTMIARGQGGIVNFSSTWGTTTSPLVAPYCASKWGVEGLSQALAQELPGQLFCVAVNPGVIDTEMLRLCFGGTAEHYRSVHDWARAATPFLLELTRRHNGLSLNVPDSSNHD